MADYFRYLHDESAYPAVLPTPKLQVTGLSREDERLLASRYDVLHDPPRASTYGFKIAEIEKRRCRPVWACSLNEMDFPTPPPSLQLHSYAETIKIVDESTYFMQLDGRSMYDQFPLSEPIKKFYAFKMHNGTTVALNRAPMGFKFSHGIAQLTSETIAFDQEDETQPMESASIIHLDNFGLSWKRIAQVDHMAEKSQIVDKITKIFTRATETGFQFNEFSKEEVLKYLESSPDTRWEILKPHLFTKDGGKFTFLGIQYELRHQGNTKTISSKSAAKLSAVKEITAKTSILPQASFRQIAMLVGIVRFCSKVLQFHNEDFNAYDQTRQMAKLCQEDIKTWDTQIGVHFARNLFPFVHIAQKILVAEPKRIRPTWNFDKCIIIFVDASKVGWGGIAIFPDGTKQIAKARWLQPALWESSVKAEPRAVEEILMELKLPRGSQVIFATDHEGLVWASQAVQIHTYTYHKAMAFVEASGIQAAFTFIQGVQNPADEPSRDRPSTATDRQLQVMGAAAGAGVAWALHFPSSKRTPNMFVNCGL
jgi:hypothetical protein